MRVTLMLADSAQVSEGKIHLLGGGWSITGPPAPSAIAILVEVPWDQTNRKLEWRLELVDSDGYPVLTPDGEGGENPIMMGGEFEVGRPPGTPHGAPIGLPLALNLAPLPLAPGLALRVALHARRRVARGLAAGLQHALNVHVPGAGSAVPTWARSAASPGCGLASRQTSEWG